MFYVICKTDCCVDFFPSFCPTPKAHLQKRAYYYIFVALLGKKTLFFCLLSYTLISWNPSDYILYNEHKPLIDLSVFFFSKTKKKECEFMNFFRKTKTKKKPLIEEKKKIKTKSFSLSKLAEFKNLKKWISQIVLMKN